jgi:hypothetical protein
MPMRELYKTLDQDNKIEQQRKMFFQIVEKSNNTLSSYS